MRGPRQDQGQEEGARGGALLLTCSCLAGDSATPPWAGTQSCFSLGLEERERKAAAARLPPGGSRQTSLHQTKVPAPCPSLQTLYKCPVSPSICQIQFFSRKLQRYIRVPSMGFSRQEYWSGLLLPSLFEYHNQWLILKSHMCKQ